MVFIEEKSFLVVSAYADKISERFNRTDFCPDGLLKKQIWQQDSKQEYITVKAVFFWQSREAYKAWKKSPEHLAAHQNKPAEQPDYIKEVKAAMYWLNAEI
ncbi:antibiotic biosynthesis monooxygenase [Stenoxybacter acetivorans]|uniref:antibiotic biosynthesis monooxygenase n=1 Tax=Stenoxybacter acetivorans TaxID=422441 RepID=UPI000564B1DB|nr:antibiotic biosynthesis monooxygenase [Stenoxybacter acetivorans]